MAKLNTNLFSVGPGAVGQGTYVVKSLTNPSRSRGVISAMFTDAGSMNPSRLSLLETQMPRIFPGTAIPLNYTFVRMLDDGNALIVANYGTNGGSSNGFKEVFSKTPNGYRIRIAYPQRLADGKTTFDGKPEPYRVKQPLDVVRWSSVVYSDFPPADFSYLKGKHNRNRYTIDGYTFDRGTLRFEGQWIFHHKYGGIDRWTRMHAVTHDPSGWINQDIRPVVVNASGSIEYERAPDTTEYDPRDLVNFPNMP